MDRVYVFCASLPNTMIAKVLGVGIAAAVVGVAKKVPNDKVKAILKPIFYRAGVIATLGLSKSPVVGQVWNKTVEPYVVDLLDNVVYAVKDGFIPGLRSDNPNPETIEPPVEQEGSDPRQE